MAAAKNKPASVGMITLPAQLVRFSSPFSSMDHLRTPTSPDHCLDKLPQPGDTQKRQCGEHQRHERFLSRVVDYCSNDCQARGLWQNRVSQVAPQRGKQVRGCELAAAVEALH